jgi:hypothetical protein
MSWGFEIGRVYNGVDARIFVAIETEYYGG